MPQKLVVGPLSLMQRSIDQLSIKRPWPINFAQATMVSQKQLHAEECVHVLLYHAALTLYCRCGDHMWCALILSL
jgi:hypothetical protein